MEQAEFDRWCAADPRHAVAAAEIGAAWSSFDHPAKTGRAGLLRGELRALDRRQRLRWTITTMSTLAAAACVALVFRIQQPMTTAPDAVAAAPASAHVTEPELKTLSDGSSVELKPGAEVEVAFNAQDRLVVLKRGVAHFSVTKDSLRPFVVQAGMVSVRAVGDRFCRSIRRRRSRSARNGRQRERGHA